MDDQIKLDSKLFISEGWDNNSDDDLSSYFQQKLTDVENTELAGDLSIEEIKKTVISMKSLNFQVTVELLVIAISFIGKLMIKIFLMM